MLNKLFLKVLLVFSLYTLCAILYIPEVFAHVLKTDGSIGAVMHIDPDDDPIAKQQAGFFFDFKDKKNKFKSENCECIFTITQDGKEIFSQPLFQNNQNPSLQSASVFFTFPERNVYQVKVSGKPNIPGDFQVFNLIYDVRVARIADYQTTTQTSNQNWISTHIPHVTGGIIMLIFLLFAIVRQFSRPKKSE